MSKLGAYVQASTLNPLGQRPFGFAQTSPASRNPSLGAYYPAFYNVPTPMNIQMEPVPNILGYMGQSSDLVSSLAPVAAGVAILGVLYWLYKKR